MAMPNLHPGPWTLAELDALPDDGNRYELVHGELLVTPAPTSDHQGIVDALADRLFPYIRENAVGVLQFPKTVIQLDDSQTEPDLMVRTARLVPGHDWRAAPLPILTVEVLSPSSRRGDSVTKRGFYRELLIPEYWIFDGEQRTVRVVRPDRDDVVLDRTLEWHPSPAPAPLVIDLVAVFTEALGPA